MFGDDIFDDIRSEIEKVFGGIYRSNNYPQRPNRHYRELNKLEPFIDIQQDKENLHIIAQLPGLNKEDINLDIRDNTVEISTKENIEIQRGYYKKIDLPVKIIPDKSSAKYKNGVLKLTISKAENTPNCKIEVE